MSCSTEIICAASRQGVYLYVDGDRLKFKAPEGALSQELREQLTAHREQIVAHLRRLEGLERQMQVPLPAIERAPDRQHLPLSYSQQGLWIIDRMAGQSSQYNLPYGFTLHGTLDAQLVERALVTIIERHEMLRTRFLEVQGEVRQHVDADFRFQLGRHDLTGLDAATRQEQIRRISGADERAPFALDRDLMVRAQLLQLSAREHVLLLNVHHIASDAWSMRTLMTEFCRLYAAYAAGSGNPLPRLALQYGDYAAWQRRWLQSATLQNELVYWRDRLQGMPRVHAIPLDKPRPQRQSFEGDVVTAAIDLQVLERIKGLCQQHGCTLFIFLQTAFAAVLYRYSGQPDIVMSTVVGGRGHPDIEPLIGFFLNTIVLRTVLQGRASFVQNLLDNRSHILGAFSHQHVPFDMVVDALNPRRSAAYSPLFQIMISLVDDSIGEMELPGTDLRLAAIKRKRSSAKFELLLNLCETTQGLRVSLTYNTGLFFAETARGMIETLVTTIEDALSHPQAQLDALPRARQAVPQSGRADAKWTPADGLRRRFVGGAAAAILVHRATGLELLSSEWLNGRTQQLMGWLHAHAGRGPVGVVLAEHAECVVGCLAALLCGRGLVVLEKAQDGGIIRRALADAGVEVVLGVAGNFPPELEANHPGCRLIDLASLQVERAAAPGPLDDRVTDETGAGRLLTFYERGADAAIRRVDVDRRELAAFLTASAPDDSALHLLMGRHEARACLHAWIFPLLCGRKVLLCETPEAQANLAATLRDAPVSDILVTGEALPLLQDPPQWPSLRRLVVLDDEAPPQAVVRVLRRSPDVSVFLLAPTAAGNVATIVCRCEVLADSSARHLRWQPQGVSVGVLDATGEEMSMDCFGVVHVQYPGETRRCSTGLRGRWRRVGGLEIAGPTAEQVITTEGPLNLTALRRRLLSIRGVDASIIRVSAACSASEWIYMWVRTAVPDDLRSAIERAAAVVIDDLESTGLRASVCILDRFPMLDGGAVDLDALAQAPDAAAQHSGPVPPRTVTERALLGLWQQVLGDKPIGVTDNFFAVGGHSLLMIMLLEKISRTLHVDVPMGSFMAAATIEALGRLVDEPAPQAAAPVGEPSAVAADDVEELVL